MAKRSQERVARHEAIEAGLRKLVELEKDRRLSKLHFQRLRDRYDNRLQQLEHRQIMDGEGRLRGYDEVEDLLIATERDTVNALYRQNKLSDESRRRIEHELDLREASSQNCAKAMTCSP